MSGVESEGNFQEVDQQLSVLFKGIWNHSENPRWIFQYNLYIYAGHQECSKKKWP